VVFLIHPACFTAVNIFLQLGTYKVKVMLAEPKTKRQRPEQLVPGLFGPGGALGHVVPLGLDAASERALWGACGGRVGWGDALCDYFACMLHLAAPFCGAAASERALLGAWRRGGAMRHVWGYVSLHVMPCCLRLWALQEVSGHCGIGVMAGRGCVGRGCFVCMLRLAVP
jgi:hypothetical protein